MKSESAYRFIRCQTTRVEAMRNLAQGLSAVACRRKESMYLAAHENARHVDLPDSRVAVCGDWHGNVGWLRTLAPAIRRLAPEVTTVLQVGDWWMDTGLSDEVLVQAGIERVFVTLGNHEPWSGITPVLEAHPGAAVRVSDVTWLLPRPFSFRIGGRQFLSLGGATSVDRLWRTSGRSWWPDEAITDHHVADARTGSADVMITHESPARTPVNAVREVLQANPFGFPEETLIESSASRARVTQVWDAVHPSILFHGHMHVPGSGATEDGRKVLSLGRDTQHSHLAFLDLQTLKVTTPSLREIREAVGHG